MAVLTCYGYSTFSNTVQLQTSIELSGDRSHQQNGQIFPVDSTIDEELPLTDNCRFFPFEQKNIKVLPASTLITFPGSAIWQPPRILVHG